MGRRGQRRRYVLGVAAALVAIAPAAPRRAAADDAKPRAAAGAASQPATILPAVVGDATRRRPGEGETDLAALLARLDELLAETSRDLGLSLVTQAGAALPDPTSVTDAEMLELSRRSDGAVIAATARVDGSEVELRVSLARPRQSALLTRTERFARDDLAVRAVVMLRDVVTDAGVVAKAKEAGQAAPAAQGQMAVMARSEGRTVLAANATLLGGMMGFSVERSSGSNDPRLLYPLLAVGAGVGLGASLLIADEWDVGYGDAWFLSAGGLWPTAAAHLIYEGRFGGASGHPGPEGDRWAFGLVGGTLGLTLSTLSLSIGDMETGGAVLAHSGGAFGLALGGMAEWFVRGSTRDTPFAGMGYGAALGWLAAAGAASTRVRLSAGRVLAVDLGAVLGGLAGAAIASPLVFDGPNSTQTRGWVGATAGGALLGAGVALWLTRNAPAKSARLAPLRLAQGVTLRPELPEVGVIGESLSSGAPIFGARFRGQW